MKSNFTPPHSHASRIRNKVVSSFSYTIRAAALCVVALVISVTFSSCHRAQTAADPRPQIDRDSLPVLLEMAMHDDARACYIIAAAVHYQLATGDTLPAISDLTLDDATLFLTHSAVLGYRPAAEAILCLVDSAALTLPESEVEFYRLLLNQ